MSMLCQPRCWVARWLISQPAMFVQGFVMVCSQWYFHSLMMLLFYLSKFISVWLIQYYVYMWVCEYLVGGLEHQFYVPINIGCLIIPIDVFIFFSEGWPNHQPVTVLLLFRGWIMLIYVNCNGTRSGMPSGHAQSSTLLATIFTCRWAQRVVLQGKTMDRGE